MQTVRVRTPYIEGPTRAKEHVTFGQPCDETVATAVPGAAAASIASWERSS